MVAQRRLHHSALDRRLIKCVPSSNNEQIQTILVNRTSLKLFAFGFVFWAE
jgi:hypothetical protein